MGGGKGGGEILDFKGFGGFAGAVDMLYYLQVNLISIVYLGLFYYVT
jgi:hypothetical protein